MDTMPFDRLTRTLSYVLSRRGLAAAIGLPAIGLADLIEARKRKKRKRKKKVNLNDFGCVNVGGFCKNGDQCCSGICEGKKGKQSCRAHGADSCLDGQTGAICGGMNVTCTNLEGGEGTCYTTTGNAPYCSATGNCFPCARDADCVPFCGPGAACIPCTAHCPTEGTMCTGRSIIDHCEFPL